MAVTHHSYFTNRSSKIPIHSHKAFSRAQTPVKRNKKTFMACLDSSDPHTQLLQPTFHFTKGQAVEVSSDEEGFRGAWYSASILEYPSKSSKKRKKALVEYKTLLADNLFSPLTAHVDPTFIRPLPPTAYTANGVFKENDVVDARYKDGWWASVVMKVLLPGRRYRIYFENLSDVLDFDAQELRLHWDWVNGDWVRPNLPQMTGSAFSSGTVVEVNLDRENVHDAWFPAVVIRENGDQTYFVKRLGPNNDDRGALKVTVDSLNIRPIPPYYADRDYELLDKVDAPYDFGWRAGVITKLLAGRRYNVFFKQENEDRELGHSEIRPHADWLDGKWVTTSQGAVVVNQEQLGVAQSGNEYPEVNLQHENPCAAKDNTVEESPCSQKRINLMEHPTTEDTSYSLPPANKKIKLTAPSGNDLHRYPSKRSTERDASRAQLSVTPLQSKKMPAEMSSRLKFCSFTQQTAARKSIFSPKLDQPTTQTQSPYTWRMTNNKRQKIVELDSPADDETMRTRPIKSLIELSLHSAPVDAAGADKDVKQSEDIKRAVEVPVIVSVQATESESKTRVEVPIIIGLEAMGKGCLHPGKHQQKNLNDLIGQKNVEHNMLKSGGGGSQRRKRGRPRKIVGIAPEVSEAGMEVHDAGDIADEMAVEDHTSNGSELPVQVVVESKVVENEPRENTGVSDTDSMTKDADEASAGVPKDLADDDKPLSTWCGGIHSSTSVEVSRLSSGEAATGLDETRERGVVPLASCTVNAKDSGSLTGNQIQITSFIKKSPVWKTIETLEVFQTVPQNPHFHPLSECKEEYREGSAIGIMVTFASLVEKICSLQFEDPRSIFDSTLESLVDLEKHGFDVVRLRDRVNELLSMKDMEGELLNESKDAETQVREHTVVRRVLDGVLNDIEKKIMELQKELAAAKSKVEAKDHEISELQTRADAANRRINNARHDFEKLATAPWKMP